MGGRSFWQTVLLTVASIAAAVLLAAAGFLILGRRAVDIFQGMAIAAVVALLLTPAFVFPLIMQQKRLAELAGKLRRLADEDDLTGLFNRRSFLSHVRKDVACGGREQQAYAILMIDLDYFKAINDRFGHAAGDLVLAAVGRKTRQIVEMVAPSTSCTGRLGGEEFAVYLPAGNAAQAPVLAEVICQVIRDWAIRHDRHIIRLTASVGVAVVPGGTPVEQALCLADTAAYAAKSSGRDRWVRAPQENVDRGRHEAA